jgi:hypothetical protein
VRQVNNEANAPAETVIIDLKNTNNVIRRPIRADSAIMHLTEPIIALKAQGRTLQLFNLETKERLQTYSHQEDIQFWRWVSQTTLALVSTKAVYHWDVLDSKNAVAPRKIFDRGEQLEVCTKNNLHAGISNICVEQPNHQLRHQRRRELVLLGRHHLEPSWWHPRQHAVVLQGEEC